MITVLVLASSPLDRGQLHLGKEAKLIKHTLDSARNREQYRVVHCMATTPDDLRTYLLEYSPTIVHFCGHGEGPAGLCFEDPSGNAHVVSGASLAKLFHLVSSEVKCVVLNACYSDEQARPLSDHIDFVVGMRDTIDDLAALKFAEGFYQAAWAGQSLERAFKFGCSAIDTAGLPDDEIPILLRSPRLGGRELSYDEKVQEIENYLLRYVNSSVEERIALTVEGEAIANLARAHYGQAPLGKWNATTVLSTGEIAGDSLVVEVLVQGDRGEFEHTYYLRRGPTEFLVYWKATLGYWEIPARTLFALGAEKPVIARVIASLDDYYNFGYEPDSHVSIALSNLEGTDFAGYLARTHEQFQEIVGLLHDGRQHRLIFEVRAGRPGRRLAEIVRFVSDSWILPSGGDD